MFVVPLCMPLLGDVFEDMSDSMLYLELALHVFLSSDGDKTLYFSELSLVCLGLAGGSG